MKIKFFISVSLLALTLSAARADEISDLVRYSQKA